MQTKVPKVVGMNGKRRISALSSAERGSLVNVVTCMNAAGHYIPPKLVWPRTNMKIELTNETPPGSTYACHKLGWI